MKRGTKFLIAWIIFSLIGTIVVLMLKNINDRQIIAAKDKSIQAQRRLQQTNERLTSNQDSVIKLQERSLLECQQELRRQKVSNNDQHGVLGFTFGDKSISVEELLKITNDALKENRNLKADLAIKNFKLKTMKEKFGLSFRDTSNRIILEEDPASLVNKIDKLARERDSIARDLSLHKSILGLIDKHYHIPYTVKGGTISIPLNRLDSLLDVYPVIKKRIRIKDGQAWITTF